MTRCAFVVLLSLITLFAQPDPTLEIQRLIVAGKLPSAEAAINEALKNHTNDGQLWNLMGIVRAQQNDSAGARQAFEKAVGVSPRLEPAWLNLGRLYQMGAGGVQDLEKSLAAYERVLQLNPRSAEAHHQSALLLFLKQDFVNSLKHLDHLPAADRTKRAALILRCADEAALGDTAGALKLAQRILEDPGLEESEFAPVLPSMAGRADSVVQQIIEGLDSRQLATEKTLPLLAAVYERAGDWKRMREVLEKVAARAPDAVEPLMELAQASWRQKDLEGTLGYLAHARDLDPKNGAIHFLFAITCNEMSLPVEAKLSLEKALALEPDNPYYNYAMGSVLLQGSDKALAIPYLEKSVALRPDDARVHLALATSYAGSGRTRDARAQLAIPLQDRQTRAGASYLLGCMAREEDDTDGALRYFQQVISMEPESSDAHAQLGAIFLLREDLESARRETELALRADPRNYRANDTLMRLYGKAKDPRLAEQVAKVKALIKDRDDKFTLLHRTIEFKPR